MEDNLEHSRAKNTRNTYAKIWKEYTAKYGADLPADPLNVALYLSEIGMKSTPATLRVHVSAIGAVHEDAGYETVTKHPGIKKVLQGHARKTKHVPLQASGIDIVKYEKITETAQQPRITRGGRMESENEAFDRGLIDIAMIGIMRDALLRRSECAALRWSDLSIESDMTGRLLIRSSKTDQTGKGSVRFVSEEVALVMMSIKTIKQGVPESRMFGLSASQICRRIKKACEQAGLVGDYSGHSPRIGMAIDLARDGVTLPALMEAGRWKSPSMPAHYVRSVEAGTGAVAKWHENRED